jgi:LysM repeat protein
MNIPDNKPDVNSLNLEKGSVVIEEIRPGTDVVTVRGKLVYAVLYHTLEEGSSLVSIEGKIPFEEKINVRGTTLSDTVFAEGEVEDLTIGLINSRKINVQSVITLRVWAEELYDEEAPIGIHGEEPVQYRRMPINLAQIVISKNDVYRVKDEVTLPSGYPNIFQILWDTISLGDVEFRVMDGKIALQGDVHLFVLYEGEGEEHPIRTFETMVPFNGLLDCYGCREGMIPDIRYHVSSCELTVRPDFDGEERNIGLEMTMDIKMRIYEEEETEILADIYGVSKEVSVVTHPAQLRQLLSKVTGKMKVTDHIAVGSGNKPILQLLHSEGTVLLEEQQAVDNGIWLRGSLLIKVMYITGDDEMPYSAVQAQIPYEYTLEIPGIGEEDMSNVQVKLEQLQVTMLDGEEMDVKAILSFHTTAFKMMNEELITQLNVSDLDTVNLGSLPGIIIYSVKEGDSLWSIGRKYYVTVDTLRELNDLSSDDLQIGQKLLIVKGN